MTYTEKDHTFVICAYKDNPYLEETILSLKNQTLNSLIYLSTSTPSDYINEICRRHEIPVFINENPKNAGVDWNFAYMQAKTELITVAHQDDIYEIDFLEQTIIHANKYNKSIMFFTDYYEFKLGEIVKSNILLKIKRIMNWPLRFRIFQNSKFIRRRILGFGCPINCPSVTYVKSQAGYNFFDTKYINSCDYKTWVDLAKLDGRFVYIAKPLMGHRIYAESATTKNLGENIRTKEDYEILCELWPKQIAKIINRVYSQSEKSNKV